MPIDISFKYVISSVFDTMNGQITLAEFSFSPTD